MMAVIELTFFSPRDMMMIEHVPELIKAGIDSFKIEGRARSPDYGAMVTNVYRQAIDKYYENPKEYKVNPQWIEELKSVFNRGFDTGFTLIHHMKQVKIISQNSLKKILVRLLTILTG